MSVVALATIAVTSPSWTRPASILVSNPLAITSRPPVAPYGSLASSSSDRRCSVLRRFQGGTTIPGALYDTWKTPRRLGRTDRVASKVTDLAAQLQPIGVAFVLGFAPALIARWKRRRIVARPRPRNQVSPHA